MVRCCGEPMRKLRDTITKINRYVCDFCGNSCSTNAIDSIALNVKFEEDNELSTFSNKKLINYIDSQYISRLKHAYKELLITPDEDLTPHKIRRKKNVKAIIAYWERIKRYRRCKK